MSFKLFRKAQAALEFLTTYGWAFMVIIIMIGALAYFGILNPTKLLPDRCTFGSEISCLDFQIKYGETGINDGNLKLRLKNNLGEAVNLYTINVRSDTVVSYECDPLTAAGSNPQIPSTPSGSILWKSGNITDFTFVGCSGANAGISVGTKTKVFISLNYSTASSGPNYAKEVNGELLTTVVQ